MTPYQAQVIKQTDAAMKNLQIAMANFERANAEENRRFRHRSRIRRWCYVVFGSMAAIAAWYVFDTYKMVKTLF